jgi:hypothetical protein
LTSADGLQHGNYPETASGTCAAAQTPESRDVRAVGPYVESIATFLPYPGSRVQVIAARFHEAKCCEGDQVRCERWFDPQEGGAAFILDVLVANGQLIRKWSEEKKQCAYRKADIREASQFAI